MDLFCGAGGLTHGMRAVGIDVRAGYDIDVSCKHAYEANNAPARFHKRDIRKVRPLEIRKHYPEGGIRVLAGCAPCTPFSALRRGEDTSSDDEWSLLGEFARLVSGVEPDLVTMENVPQVRRHRVFADFVEALSRLGYSISCNVVHCEDYGVPQERTRLVLLASRLAPIRLLPPTVRKARTVQQAIGKLPSLAAGQKGARDPIHRAAKLRPQNLRRIRASIPGGTWEDWPARERLACHKKASGLSYRDVYGRMEWTKPSPPITTKFFNLGSGRFGHPTQDRALSIREGALLQTFPATYEFSPRDSDVNLTKLGMLIGNAVPPRLGELVGASLRHHVALLRPATILPPAPGRWVNPLRRAAMAECGLALRQA